MFPEESQDPRPRKPLNSQVKPDSEIQAIQALFRNEWEIVKTGSHAKMK